MQQHHFKFVIPQKFEDLLHPEDNPDIYFVNDELTALEIAQRLPQSDDKIRFDPFNIIDEFHVFYSVLKNFNELDSNIIDTSWVAIYKATDYLKEQLREKYITLNESFNSQSIRDPNHSQRSLNVSQVSQNRSSQQQANLFESLEEKIKFSNSLKMLTYLSCTFIQQFEDAMASQNHRQNFNETYSETPGPKRKKKRNQDNDASGVSFKSYDRYNVRVVKSLTQLISMPLNKFSESPTEARELVGTIMRACYKMIENSAINGLQKNKDLLDLNFSIIGCGIEKYNQSLTFCLKFIQLLQYREQLAPLLADLVEFIVVRHNQRLLIGEILREIDRIDIKELSRDSSCPRAVSTFLINLSEKCAKDFIPSLNHIFDYLEQDSYIMRNASLSVMANLIINVLHEKEEDKTLRDEILDALMLHIRDITGYTRAKALTVWCTLCENQCIPITYISRVTIAAVGRLKDKSCFVRKSAVRFIISILSRNAFGCKRLPLNVFVEKYKEAKEKLDQLLEEERVKLADDIENRPVENGAKEDTMEEDDAESSQNTLVSDATEVTQAATPMNKMKDLTISEDSQVVGQQRVVTYLQDAISFTMQIHKAIPLTTDMLTSKNVTDIQEAIDFFVHCYEFGIDEALVGFKKMISLINVQEKSVQDTVASAYKRIFFESARYEGKSNRDSLVVTNFINFIRETTIGEFISLESLVGQFKKNGDITKEMEQELFARFTRIKPGIKIEESVAAIQMIGMLAAHQPDIINHNLSLCVKYGLSSNEAGCLESQLARETCIAIRKSLPRKIEDKKRSLRLAKDDELFVRLQCLIVDSFPNVASEHWFSLSDEAMRIIFDLAENPEQISESLYQQLAERLLRNCVPSTASLITQETNRNESPELVFQPSALCNGTAAINTGISSQQPTSELVNPLLLARFIHFLGSVALNLAVFLELHVLLELKIRSASSNDQSSVNNISAHNLSISNRRRSRRYGANKSMEDANLEEEIGLAGAEGEDAELEFIASICDEEIVCGKNLIAKVSKVITEVVIDPFRYPNLEIKLASALALAKFMMVSAKYCNDHLRLLFTILEKSKHSEIKINLLIAISDLCIRFPNQLDGWNGKIFDCLQDPEVRVRRVALKILSRLVLCDILKAKDQISTMANLIVDDDEQIASYSRHFFLELSKKLNAIYNVLPDIISRLSDSKTGISEENFRIVMRFMFDLIDKSAHIDRLVDKLCGRFMDTDDERHWSDLAFCLSLLKYSDKSMVKLYDKFDCYKDKLCIDSVKDSICLAVANYRKTPHLKNDMKQLLDEFEAKLQKQAGDQAESTPPASVEMADETQNTSSQVADSQVEDPQEADSQVTESA